MPYGVEFEGDWHAPKEIRNPNQRGLVGWLMRKSNGRIKTSTQANIILFIFALVILIASLYFFKIAFRYS